MKLQFISVVSLLFVGWASFGSHEPPSQQLIKPAKGNLSQGFKPSHEGIDIANHKGTPIVAAAAGTVIQSGWDTTGWGLGNVVRIKHPDGSIAVYAHNDRLLVKKGEEVSQGQQIAEMGSTGNSTGPHLHFEYLKPDGTAEDPSKLISKASPGKDHDRRDGRKTTVSLL